MPWWTVSTSAPTSRRASATICGWVGLNFEFAYKFPRRTGWQLYAGGGPAINLYSFDRGPGNDRDTDSQSGLNVMVGVEQASGLFFEFKIGAIDSPDMKFGVGWIFR